MTGLGKVNGKEDFVYLDFCTEEYSWDEGAETDQSKTLAKGR